MEWSNAIRERPEQMANGSKISWVKLIGRAVLLGVFALVFVPIGLAVLVIAIGYLSGGCGPGDSGGCYMSGGVIAIYAALPAFILGFGWSVFRDLRSHRR